MCKTDNWLEAAVYYREHSLVLRDDLEEWDGVQEGGYICVYIYIHVYIWLIDNAVQ